MYYLISDLHIGGDGELDTFESEAELIRFLKQLAEEARETELIILGDLFGLWEMTRTPGAEKIRTLAFRHPDLFRQFRDTGAQIRITLIPGNHDYELSWVKSYVSDLKKFNIYLEPVRYLTREIGGRRLWIEHGSEYDPFNRSEAFGDPHALPFGYYVVANVCATAGQISGRSPSNWLHDVESVYPNEDIPFWAISNYFYREMTSALRLFLLPFLVLFGVSGLALGGLALEGANIISSEFFTRKLGEIIGFPDKLFELILVVDGVLFLLLVALSIPTRFVLRDLRRVLRLYRVDQGIELNRTKENTFLDAAKAVFASDPSVLAFIYGHTHRPSLTRIDDRYVLNTGTWLKRLIRMKPWLGLLPGVFVPYYHLNYYRIDVSDGKIRILYRRVPKDRLNANGLTRLQRLLILGKKPVDLPPIPEETLIPIASR